MPIADLTTLVNATAQNLSQLKGLSVAYNLLGGAPSIAGYTALINGNNSSNFGAGAGVTFNDENVYINVLNALYQGNADAKTAFDAIVSGGASLSDKLELVYSSLIPASARSDAGLNFFKSQSAFYEARAAELGVAGSNGAALVAYAALAKIAVDSDIGGLGDTVNDLVAAVQDGSAALPEDGAAFTPLETADGTGFDGDDINPLAVTLTNGVDVLTGNEFNAPRGFTPGGTDQVNTLDSDDVLTGTGTNPTLNLTFVTDADTGLNNITPTMKGVETANVRFEGGIGTTQILDLQDSAGVKNVNLSSIAEAQNVSVQNIAEAGANNLSINNSQSPNSTINFRYIDSAVAGAADTANLLLNNAGTGFLNLQSMTGKEGIETLNLTSSGGANSVGQTTAQDLMTVNIAGDQSLLLGNSADTLNGATVEATQYGAGFANVAGSLSKIDASALKAGLEVNLGGEVVALKDGTSGVNVDFAFTGTAENDTVRLLAGLNKGDTIDLGAGTGDRVSLFQSATAGSIAGTESVSILSGHDAGTGADTINFDTSIAPDLKDVFIRNEGQDLVAGNWVSKAEAMTVNLTKVSTEVAANLTVAHGTTGNNGLAGNLITVAPATDGAADLVGLKIVDGMNADPRFNAQLQAVKYESVTLTDSDTESNTVQLGLAGNVLPHTGTVTVTGGQAGQFFNLDATANILRKDVTGGSTDGSGIVDVGAGPAERFSASKIDASGSASDVIVRVDTLRDAAGVEQPGGGQNIMMGAGNDWVIFDELGDTTAGLTINDTVAGGAGNDTLAIDGNGVKVNISASEWTNVTGFENIHLVGNGAVAGTTNLATAPGAGDAYGRNNYNLTLTNDLIAANGVGSVINIINDNDPLNGVGVADTAGTGVERGATIDARGLSAQNSFTYNGEEGGSQTADRFILSDANVNGKAVIDGGAVLGGGNTASNLANTDVMEVRNSAVVTTGDLTGLSNIGTVEFTNDQAAPQTSVLQLDNASVDALVNSSRAAAAGFEETLTVRAYDNPLLPAATTTLNLDASQVTNSALQINVAGAGGNDTIVGGAGNDAMTGGAGVDSMTGGAGADVFTINAGDTGITLATADTITDFATGVDKIATFSGAGNATIADGSALANFAAFAAAATAAFTGANTPNNDDVYVAWNAEASGNAYVAIDENDNGTFDAGDSLVVLTGINTAAEIATADFI